jgi:sterol desaturase/sphingolipid hydroxylase (fatty acid hydroxylase superfamily)
MDDLANINEPAVRVAVFVLVFVVMASLERMAPKRKDTAPKWRRWSTNISMIALGSLVVRALAILSVWLAVPLAAVAAAEFAAAHGWGLLNAWSSGPGWLKVLITVVALDLAVYLQHVASHRFAVLWRIHRMHHADTMFDVTTAIRFHPVEIGLSALYKAIWVLALGPSIFAVVLFEIILNGCAMFNHSNVDLPVWVDCVLRAILVTPDMHRVHHSIDQAEHDSNYGFNLSLWDRLFSTYVGEPRKGHQAMTIGLAHYQSDAPSGIGWSLALPFAREDRAAARPGRSFPSR